MKAAIAFVVGMGLTSNFAFANSALVQEFAYESPHNYSLTFYPRTAVSHSGRMIAEITSESDSIHTIQEYVYLTDTQTHKVTKFKIDRGGLTILFTPDDKYLIVSLGRFYSELSTWDVEKRQRVKKFCWDQSPSNDFYDGYNLAMEFSADGTLFYRGSNNKMLVEDPTTCQVVQTLTTTYDIRTITIVPPQGSQPERVKVGTNTDSEGGGLRIYVRH